MITQIEVISGGYPIMNGFGFLCMKAAYINGVTGKMNYGPGIGMKIIAEGEEPGITAFVKWIELNIGQAKQLHYRPAIPERKFKEFDIDFVPFV